MPEPDDAGRAPGWDDVVRDLRRGRGREPEARSARGRHAAAGAAGRGPGLRGRLVMLVAGSLVVVLAAGAHTHRTRSGAASGPDGGTVGATARPAGWTEIVRGLDEARARAWGAGDDASLRAVDVPGSAAERADLRAGAALRSHGVRPTGLRFELRAVEVVRVRPARAVLRVVDRRPAYTLVDRSGRVVQRVPARGAQVWELELRRLDVGWRIAAAAAVGAPAGASGLS